MQKVEGQKSRLIKSQLPKQNYNIKKGNYKKPTEEKRNVKRLYARTSIPQSQKLKCSKEKGKYLKKSEDKGQMCKSQNYLKST